MLLELTCAVCLYLTPLTSLSIVADVPPPPSAPAQAKPAKEPAKEAPEDARVAKAREVVTTFFGAAFPREFGVTVSPDRKAFDAHLKEAYGWPGSECWMVATGIDKGIVILDPAVWKTDACEHDGTNEAHVLGIVTHELVHVYHGQQNKTGDFTGMDDLGWFVEGLAVYASGQLDVEHADKDQEALKKNAGPKDLKTAWSGRYRYAVCGSLVRYIDQKFGREKLVALLAVTTPDEFHATLGATEAELLRDWATSVEDRAAKKP